MHKRTVFVAIGIILTLPIIDFGTLDRNRSSFTVSLETLLEDRKNENADTQINHTDKITIPLTPCRPEFLVHGGLLRSYYVYVPNQYEQSVATPLVIALHAGGSFAVRMMFKTNLTDHADKYNFLLVFPNGITRLNPFWRMWNGGYCCGVAYERNVDDIGYIRALIQHLQPRYNIDLNRIYVTGHSNGAILAYRLASELSEIIAAVAPVAGAIGGTASDKSPLYVIPEPVQPVSVIAFHGKLDENVPYQGGQANNSWGTGTDLSVNESIAFWVLHNNCTPTPETTISSSGNIIIDRYSNGDNGTEVVLYSIINGGHGWPGSSYGDRPSQEISATDIMWDFFAKHPKK